MSDKSNPEILPHPAVFVEKRRLELIKGYILNEKRTPVAELIVTPQQTIGPFFPRALVAPGANDLTCVSPGMPMAQGEHINLIGSIYDEAGSPIPGALLEIWQANRWGRYDHPTDQSDLPTDANFRGFGQTLSDSEGSFRFRTIKPGAYLNPGYDNWLRPPHIHFSIFGAGIMQRIITQMYFPGEPLNDIDPILNGVTDLAARSRLISALEPAGADDSIPTYRFDIVLRGKLETPFFAA